MPHQTASSNHRPVSQPPKADVIGHLAEYNAQAKQLLKKPIKTGAKLRRARQKAVRIELGSFQQLREEFFLMIELIKAYLRRDYRRVPVSLIVTLLGAVLYVVSPIDLIPDLIPGLGFVDDALVISLVLRQVRGELEQFRAWQANVEVEFIPEPDNYPLGEE